MKSASSFLPSAQDNKSCIYIAENPGRISVRCKHIDVKLRWIQDAIEEGTFGLIWVPRKDMVADIGNQPQVIAQHRAFTEVLRGQHLVNLPGGRKREAPSEEEDDEGPVDIEMS